MNHLKYLVLIFILYCTESYAQWESTGSSNFYYNIPQPKKVGDTVYDITDTYKSNYPFVLDKIDDDSVYHFRRLCGYPSTVKIKYCKGRLLYYDRKYNSYKGTGLDGFFHGSKGGYFFTIKFDELGNLKSFFTSTNRGGDYIVYKTLNYHETDRSKLKVLSEYQCRRICGKWKMIDKKYLKDGRLPLGGFRKYGVVFNPKTICM